MRTIFGMEPLWVAQVYVTAIAALTTIGFLIGIGCFDWWWQWMTGRRVDGEDHSMHGAHGWRDYFKVNTDHKVIGVQYMAIVFTFFVLAGLFAEAVRAELFTSGQTLGDGETYNGLFSVHATVMIFLFVIPAFAGLANFILPIMIGAKDMAFPRLNALSVWMLVPGGLMMIISPVFGAFSAGWTAYVPLATQGGTGATLFEVGVQVVGASSIATAINFLVTIFTMRAPGMTVWRMPLLVWANATTSALVVFGTPFIAGSQFMTLFDRVIGTQFFDPSGGGDVIAYQHIFWFYSHPAVYIMMLPGFGIISE
ncbi:MAG: cbb3-type cytochrome c oxidase subunit I, partial [Thermoleophilia bacterium]|nr:cbb3-type cytochrome c oxidase subunit I [Thermoleophilia bacterium]